MRILGIDPALSVTGYGVVEIDKENIKIIEAGTIKTLAKSGLPARLNSIYTQILDLIKYQK